MPSDRTDPYDSSGRDWQLDELLAELIRAEEAGESINCNEVVRQHPDLADELNEFFAQRQRIKQIVSPLRDAAARVLHVRCPHCHNPIELVEAAPLTDISCPSCGSSFSLVTDRSSSHFPSVGKTVGHFELLDHVGIGQFGSVWKARDTKLDRTVAIKIPRNGQLDESQTAMFLRDARAAAQLKHPNIVSVHEVGKQDDTLYIVSDFIQGMTLKEWMAANKPTPRESAELCVKIAKALHHAHEAGVIHRDLKPSNIMIERVKSLGSSVQSQTDSPTPALDSGLSTLDSSEPHIVDFGLAKREAGEITMTVEGQILGTPAYMSPEQARGEGHTVDRRADIYSLGVILFELLTGELPFRGEKQMLIVQILNDDPPSPRKLNSRVPRDLETICLKSLEKDPNCRYATAYALAQDLDSFVSGHSIVARPLSRVTRAYRWAKRKPSSAGILGMTPLVVGMLVALVVGGYYNARLATSNNTLSQLAGQREEALANAERERVKAEKARTRAVAGENAARQERAAADRARQQAIEAEERARRYMFASHLNIAQQAINSDDLRRAYSLLELFHADKKLCRFEWHYLWEKCRGEAFRFQGHTHTVDFLAHSQNDRMFVSASNGDNSAIVWDVAVRRQIKRCVTPFEATCLTFGPKDQFVLFGTSKGELWRWDLNGDPFRVVLLQDLPPLTSIHISPSGKLISTGHLDGSIALWDASVTLVTKWDGHQARVNGMCFSPQSHALATVGDDGQVMIWKLSDIPHAQILGSGLGSVCDVVFSPDGEFVAAVAVKRNNDLLRQYKTASTISVWDRHSNELVKDLVCEGEAGHLAISPDGSRVVVTGVFTKQEQRTPLAYVRSVSFDELDDPIEYGVGYHSIVNGVLYSANGSEMTAAVANTLKTWSTSTGDCEFTIEDAEWGRSSLAMNSSDKLATIHRDHPDWCIKVWDTTTQKLLMKQEAEGTGWIYDVTFSPQDHFVAAACLDGVRCWNVESGELIKVFRPPSHEGKRAGVWCARVCFDPSERFLACAHSHGTVVWEIESDKVILDITNDFSKRRDNWSSGVAFATDGRRLARSDRFGGIEIWNVEGNEKLLTIPVNYTVVTVAFSPDGKLVAGSGFDAPNVEIWDAENGGSVGALRGHLGAVLDVDFSSDGTRLLTASKDGTVRLWDAATYQQLLMLGQPRPRGNDLSTAAFSQDGKRIAANYWNGAHVWEVPGWE